MALITAANLEAAKPSISNGTYSGGTPLPGSIISSTAPSYTQNAAAPAAAPSAAPKTTPTPTSTNNTSRNNTGGDSSGSDSAAASAAAAAAAAKASQITNAINFGVQGVNQAAASGTTSAVANLGALGSGDVYGPNGVQQTQNNIDLARTQIGETQINSIRQLQQAIKDGLQGTGVQLGNSGALDSSAANAAARAYATYGDVQTNSANNTAAVSNQAQDTAQGNLNLDVQNDKTQIDDAKTEAVNNIVSQAQQALTQLGTVISVYLQGNANLIPTQQIQNQIISTAQSQLAQVDSNYQSILSGINPESAGQIATAAEAGSNAGVVPASQAPYNPAGSGTVANAPAIATEGGAPAPSLIPLTLGPVGSNQTQIPGQ